MKKVRLFKTSDFASVLNDTIDFAKEVIVIYSKGFLYFVMPPLVLLMAAVVYMFTELSEVFGAFRYMGMAPFDLFRRYPSDLLSSAVGYLFAILLLGFIVVWAQSILAFEIVLLYEQAEDPSDINLQVLWEGMKAHALRMAGSFISYTFLMAILAAITLGIIALCVKIGGFATVLAGFGSFLGWMYILYATTPYYFIIRQKEGLGLFESLVRCFTLIRGYWWRSFGIIFVTGLLASVLRGIIVFPLAILAGLMSTHQLASGAAGSLTAFTSLTGFTQVVSLALALYLSAIPWFAGCINYYSLIEQSDNIALLNEIQSIGEKSGPSKQEGEY